MSKKSNRGYSIFPVVVTFMLCSIFTFVFINISICCADIFKYIDEKGVPRFTNIKKDTRYKLYIKVENEDPGVFMNKYGSLINQASKQFNLKPSLVKAVIMVESGFDPKAISKKGAQGLMQLMPKTAADMAVEDPHNPEENIFGGTRYLSKLMERFKNDIKLALAAYNAGPERVEEYKGVPPFPETERFINKVMSFYKQYELKK
ncbi:lytic transglycosylase domain-containing protein [Thermodesulfobacteriota bacterium]